ncbi:metal-dependent hydrolase [Halorarius litoreus]|uniref:metal-dependent hydrolase n=1 Tax=Halorarius litoreus TaxID=2962676 RepID=UPI0020CBED7C|nr:metal-dependent hydrolase [Halorarius litoreus]
MWPWEHLAFGYLLYSLLWRVYRGEGPTEGAALLLVVGTQVPDLVDKPLSWEFGVFPTGHALGHSVLVAVPLAVLVLAVARRYGRLDLGSAFVVGQLSHILGDVIDPLRAGSDIAVGRALWPVVTGTPYDVDYGISRGFVYLAEFAAEVATQDPASLLLYLTFPLLGGLLWLADGAPGPRGAYRLLAAGIRRQPPERTGD